MPAVIRSPRFVYVPPGGYALPCGRVLSAAEATTAVAIFARRTGYSARAVRTAGDLYRRAMAEYAAAFAAVASA